MTFILIKLSHIVRVDLVVLSLGQQIYRSIADQHCSLHASLGGAEGRMSGSLTRGILPVVHMDQGHS